MTAIVGVLNSQGVAIAADSAVTVTGNNGKKVFNRSNKIFTLSKYHPVGIAIYSNADFLGIPLETLVKLYRSKIKDTPYKTLNEYKLDFIIFLKSKVNLISREYKRDAFYNFCSEAFKTVKDNIIRTLDGMTAQLAALQEADAIAQIDAATTNEMDGYLAMVDGLSKATYVDISTQDFSAYYTNEIAEISSFVQGEIQKLHPLLTFKSNHISKFTDIFHSLANLEFIFEQHSGLVFIGFGDDEIFPSSQLVLLGTLIADNPRIRIFEKIAIEPGKSNSNILPYVQGDVTTAVLTGVDPNYKAEAMKL